jgi:hypothetical protein
MDHVVNVIESPPDTGPAGNPHPSLPQRWRDTRADVSHRQLSHRAFCRVLYGRANWAKRRARESASMLMFWQIEALHFGDEF